MTLAEVMVTALILRRQEAELNRFGALLQVLLCGVDQVFLADPESSGGRAGEAHKDSEVCRQLQLPLQAPEQMSPPAV